MLHTSYLETGVALMAASGSSFQLITAIAACGLGVVTVDAAEIRADPYYERGGRVILEGKIETGDFDKLRSFVFEGERGVGLFAIYLASPGGDLAEAMKIGRLVRGLKWATEVPSKWSSSDLREIA